MNAIDFSKITKTVDGLNCQYFGQRISGGKVIHRFVVYNDSAELINYYDDQGQRVEFSGAGGWLVSNGGHQIIKQPKIVEVAGWVALYPTGRGGYCFGSYTEEPIAALGFLAKQQHTFRFEVPND